MKSNLSYENAVFKINPQKPSSDVHPELTQPFFSNLYPSLITSHLLILIREHFLTTLAASHALLLLLS